MDRNTSWRRDGNKEDLQIFTDEFIIYLQNNIHSIFKKKRDIDVAYSILEYYDVVLSLIFNLPICHPNKKRLKIQRLKFK